MLEIDELKYKIPVNEISYKISGLEPLIDEEFIRKNWKYIYTYFHCSYVENKA